jgi:hypothetical protein
MMIATISLLLESATLVPGCSNNRAVIGGTGTLLEIKDVDGNIIETIKLPRNGTLATPLPLLRCGGAVVMVRRADGTPGFIDKPSARLQVPPELGICAKRHSGTSEPNRSASSSQALECPNGL